MQSPLAFIRGVQHPEAFHGQGRNVNFFEGWYVKLVNPATNQRWAVIPGVFRGMKNASGVDEDKSFVQVLDGGSGRSWFHEFPVDEFSADTKSFNVTVGPNHFSSNGVQLDLPQLRGEISYTTPIDPWPVTFASPGIMGWYGLVPFMECFHGVVSFGHQLQGELSVEGQAVSFTGGKGYIEKDWGSAFPAGYIWMQSNHFVKNSDASLIASAAIIPWLTGSFRGFIVGLRLHGRLYKWTTYNRSKESQLALDDEHLVWSLTGPYGCLDIRAHRASGGLLHAPMRTAMYQRVEETMSARIELRLTDSSGRVVFDDVGDAACMEVFGDLDRLLAFR